MIQETLEEVAERLYPTPNPYVLGLDIGNSMKREAFINGAKWQAEIMYSEEEVLDLLNKREDYINSEDNIFDYQSINQLFEQFKKK